MARDLEKVQVVVAECAISEIVHPTEWSTSYKTLIVALASLIGLVANMGILLAAPAAPVIVSEFDDSSPSAATLLVTVWELGEGLGPFVLGPLSEHFGRALVFNAANALLVLFSIGAALSSSIGLLIGFRFLCGCAITSTVLNSCIVSDIYRTDQRGTALSWMSITPWLGPALGPVLGGLITERLGWRWTFWILAISTAALGITFYLVARETYFPVILEQHRRKNGIEDGASPTVTPTSSKRAMTAIRRPFVLLYTQPHICILALSWTLALTHLQIMFNTISLVYDTVYNFSVSQVGLTYLGLACGLIVASLTCSQTLDRYSKHQKKRHGGYRAKDRLPAVMVGTLSSCIAVIWFGWAAQKKAFWLVPILGTFFSGFGFTASIIGTQSYIIDSFGDHAASAITGAIAIRNLTAAFFPLVGPELWSKVGYGWGATILALLGLLVLPTPLLLSSFEAHPSSIGADSEEIRVLADA